MLLHPYLERDKLQVYQGTRLLVHDFGLVGVQIQDVSHPRRVWVVQSLFAPIPRRALGGIRAKVVDNKGVVGFINQRDLEVLIGLAEPGQYCSWLRETYPDPDERAWCGVCVDDDDLLDDLYERELLLRGQFDGFVPENAEISRRVHLGGHDAEELHVLYCDGDPFAGIYPDPRFVTVQRRWTRIERNKVRWEEIL